MRYYFSCISLVFSLVAYAQTLNTKWIDLTKSNKAIHQKIVGVNTNYIYTIDSSAILKKDFSKHLLDMSTFKINAIEKSKWQIKKVLELKGKVLLNEKEIKLTFYKTVILEKKVLVFWINNLRKTETLYVQMLSEDLETSSEIKQIFVLKTAANTHAKYNVNTTLLYHPSKPNQFIIGGEKEAEMFKKIPFEYSIFDSAFNVIKSNTVNTPAILEENQKGNALTYQLEADGKIYGIESARIKVYLSPPSKMIIINPETNQSVSKVFNSPQLFDFSYCLSGDKLSIIGFVDEVKEEEESLRYTGLYFAELDKENLNLKYEKRINFNKSVLTQLFKDNPNELKSELKIWHRDDERMAVESSLHPSFEIEKFVHSDSNQFLILGSRNWISKSAPVLVIPPILFPIVLAYDDPGLLKGNIIAFNFSSTAGLKWQTSIDRQTFYSYHFLRPDVLEIKKNGIQYLFYPSKKNKMEKQSDLAYTTISNDSTKVASGNLNLGASGKISDIQKFGDHIYFTSFDQIEEDNITTYIGEIILP